MDPHDRDLLQRSLDLSEKNNKMIKKLYKHMRVQRVFHIIYWIIIIGASIGLYYWVQPAVDKVIDVYTNFSNPTSTIQNIFTGGQ